MKTTEQELHLMQIHVFNSEEERMAALAQGLIGENDLALTPDTGSIDTAMSDTSENPVQNRVIKKYIDDAIAAIGGRQMQP